MGGFGTCDHYTWMVNRCFPTHGAAERISTLSQAGDVFGIRGLGTFNTRYNCGDICVFEGHFQNVERSSVRFVTNGVDTLNAY